MVDAVQERDHDGLADPLGRRERQGRLELRRLGRNPDDVHFPIETGRRGNIDLEVAQHRAFDRETAFVPPKRLRPHEQEHVGAGARQRGRKQSPDTSGSDERVAHLPEVARRPLLGVRPPLHGTSLPRVDGEREEIRAAAVAGGIEVVPAVCHLATPAAFSTSPAVLDGARTCATAARKRVMARRYSPATWPRARRASPHRSTRSWSLFARSSRPWTPGSASWPTGSRAGYPSRPLMPWLPSQTASTRATTASAACWFRVIHSRIRVRPTAARLGSRYA